jgi:broad specificity phosphatase PhoE
MPPARLFLARHGWAEHNVSDDYTLRDPKLTSTGREEAATLGRELLEQISSEGGGADTQDSSLLIAASPLRRAVETALIAFPGRRILLVPDLQECSASPCVRRNLTKVF